MCDRAVQQLAKRSGKEGKVHTVAFGAECQIPEVAHALKDCMQSDYWLVLHNAHLVETWSSNLMDLLTVCLRVFQLTEFCSETLRPFPGKYLFEADQCRYFVPQVLMAFCQGERTKCGRHVDQMVPPPAGILLLFQTFAPGHCTEQRT